MSPVDIFPTIAKEHSSRNLGALHTFMNEAPQSFPLKSCTVRANINGIFCTNTIVQHYHNPYDATLDVTYIFPLPPNGSIIGMTLRSGDLEIKAECREKEEAKKAFEKAKGAGQTASLLTQQRGDIYTLSVANIPPGHPIEVSFLLVEQLPIIDGRLRYRFPTTLAPRYTPGEPTGHSGPGVVADTDHVPDASFVNPPIVLDNGTLFQAEVHISSNIVSVGSSLHATKVTMGDGITVALSGKAKMDSDLTLEFYLPTDDLKTEAWTDGNYTSVLLSPGPNMAKVNIPREAVFIVDISGSMSGTKMQAAKLALQTAIRSLMPSDTFRLIAFDDRIEVFKEEFSKVTDSELEAAAQWIDNLSPRGGTEMLPALKKGFEHRISEGFQRTVLFITDGQAWNEEELIAAITYRKKGARLFTLGIDTAVNQNLLERMAKAGEGTCEVCTPNDDIEERVALLESRMGAPLLHTITTDCDGAQKGIPPLFTGRPICFIVKGVPSEINAIEGDSTWSEAITPKNIEAQLGVFWAKQSILELEERITLKPSEEEAIRPNILSLGLEFGLVTKYTAMIAIDPREQSRNNVVDVVQPHMLPDQWQTTTGTSFFAAAAPPPAMASGAAPPMPKIARPSRASKSKRHNIGQYQNNSVQKPQSGSLLNQVFDYAISFFGVEPEAVDVDEEVGSQSLGNIRDDLSHVAPEPSQPKVRISDIIKRQSANGSINNDLNETVASLLVFLLQGNTRTNGLRMRNVMKIVIWLESQPDSELKQLAMTQLGRAEQGETISLDSNWKTIAPGTLAAQLLS